eukprot:s763_g1.t1
MIRDIILLFSCVLGAFASGTCNVAVADYEQVCDHSTWVCRIVCNTGMLPGMKANKCVAKHCASTNNRHKHIVEKMMAASAHYCGWAMW